MKLLAFEVDTAGQLFRPALYHAHGTRRDAPLLDELGAAIDHVKPFSAGGACSGENLRTACWTCNGRKSSSAIEIWEKRERRTPVRGKYGEPQAWDGLTSMFLILADRYPVALSSEDRQWVKALMKSGN